MRLPVPPPRLSLILAEFQSGELPELRRPHDARRRPAVLDVRALRQPGLPEPVPDGVRVTGERGHDCPSCRTSLTRALLDDPQPIEICEPCGAVWLDAGELRRAVDAPGSDRRG